MPFVPYNLAAVVRALRGAPAPRLATFATPDLIMRRAAAEQVLGVALPPSRYEPRPDSDLIRGWHKAGRWMGDEGVLDTAAVLAAAGIELTAFDVHPARGGEVVHDLNGPVPAEYHGAFDAVFDCIANQCLNVGEVLRNAVRLLRPGGRAVHCLPVAAVNQGYYSVSPTLLYDFYEAAGFDVEEAAVVAGIYEDRGRTAPERVNRMRGLGDDAVLLFVARRPEAGAVVPGTTVMTKFRRSPSCHRE